jgi:hypothetical protein
MRKRKEYFPCVFGSRVDTSTMAWLEKGADESRMSVSAYVRRIIEQEAMRDLQRSEGNGDGGLRIIVDGEV